MKKTKRVGAKLMVFFFDAWFALVVISIMSLVGK